MGTENHRKNGQLKWLGLKYSLCEHLKSLNMDTSENRDKEMGNQYGVHK